MLMDRKSLHMPSPLPPKNLAVTKPTLFSSAHSSQCTAPTMQLACPHTLHCKICTPCSLLNLFGLGWPERPSCLLSPQLHRAHTFSNKQVHWLEDFLNWDHSSKEESQQFLPINPPPSRLLPIPSEAGGPHHPSQGPSAAPSPQFSASTQLLLDLAPFLGWFPGERYRNTPTSTLRKHSPISLQAPEGSPTSTAHLPAMNYHTECFLSGPAFPLSADLLSKLENDPLHLIEIVQRNLKMEKLQILMVCHKFLMF